MKRNENVHTDDIRKISSKEFAQNNVQLEDKLFSDFLRSDYKAIKEDFCLLYTSPSPRDA